MGNQLKKIWVLLCVFVQILSCIGIVLVSITRFILPDNSQWFLGVLHPYHIFFTLISISVVPIAIILSVLIAIHTVRRLSMKKITFLLLVFFSTIVLWLIYITLFVLWIGGV